MTLRSTGELGLIERLAAILGGEANAPGTLLVGIGDDAAAWRQDRAALVATTDMLVEGVHFDLALTSWEDLGWKALAVNLSDVAAMGAIPSWALVSLALRGDIAVADVEALYGGMRAMAERGSCAVIGGDTVATRKDIVISVTALGAVPADQMNALLRRDGGRAGDAVAVTGVLGASAAGLFALQHPDSAPPAVRAALAVEHCRPRPQLAAGRLLREAGVRCAMDVSDGLLTDLRKLCAASGVGATLEAARLPLHTAALEGYPERALDWAIGGGEDYQLLFTAPPALMGRVLALLAEHDIEAAEIGRLEAHAGVRLMDADGASVAVRNAGWDHFRAGEPA